jgi:hypothetical protein
MLNPFYVERAGAGRWRVYEYIDYGHSELVMLTSSAARAEALATRLNAIYQAEERGYRRAHIEFSTSTVRED